jgi:hypothetical protein
LSLLVIISALKLNLSINNYLYIFKDEEKS